MVGFLHAGIRDAPSFHTLLPHSLVLDPDAGIVLLQTPPGLKPFWMAPTLALGCAWQLTPRNMDPLDDTVCQDIARLHTHVLRGLPVGAAFQGLMTMYPSTTVPAWEAGRCGRETDPVIAAQIAAVRAGLPHREGAVLGRLRTIDTLATLRIPLTEIEPGLAQQIQGLLRGPGRQGAWLAERLRRHFRATLGYLAGLRSGLAETLRATGHAVTTLNGAGLGQALARALAPQGETLPVLMDDIPLKEQVCMQYLDTVQGGLLLNPGGEELLGQILSLHHAPLQTYPGMLSAARAPEGSTPLALWDAWSGPLTVAVNVAVVEPQSEASRLDWKLRFARIHSASNVENKSIVKELEEVQEKLFLRGGQVQWGRIHVLVWGQPDEVQRGVDEVKRRGSLQNLQFLEEPVLGSNLALQTLPLGFDPAFPSERWIQRARRADIERFGDLLPFFGSSQGTTQASTLYLNGRSEAACLDLFDKTNTNPHMVVTGTSGAGKTFGMNYFEHQVLPLDSIGLILDPLANYRGLCDVWGGTYLKLDYDGAVCINPFWGPLDIKHASFIAAFLAECASGGGQPLSWEEFNILSDAVAYFTNAWDRTRGEATLTPFVTEVLQTGCFNQKDRKAQQIARQIARKLHLFYGRGTYAGFVDRRNTFTLDPRLTVVELSALSDAEALQGILFFGLTHHGTQFFEDPSRFYAPKYILGDEVWRFLKHKQTAEVIEKIIRTYRNINTSAIFVSQRAADFESPVGKIILGIADTQLFFEQASTELAKITDLFKLDPAEEQLVRQARRHAGWTSAFLRLSNKRGGMIRIIPDRFMQVMATQEGTLAQRREELRAQHGGNLRAAIAQMLEEEAT